MFNYFILYFILRFVGNKNHYSAFPHKKQAYSHRAPPPYPTICPLFSYLFEYGGNGFPHRKSLFTKEQGFWHQREAAIFTLRGLPAK